MGAAILFYLAFLPQRRSLTILNADFY